MTQRLAAIFQYVIDRQRRIERAGINAGGNKIMRQCQRTDYRFDCARCPNETWRSDSAFLPRTAIRLCQPPTSGETRPVHFVHESLPQRVRFQAGGAAEGVKAEVARLGVERVMVIAAPAEAELADIVTSGLPTALRHDEVVMHVPVEVAQRARAAAVAHRVDAIVSVGGGSTTGLAKAVAMTCRNLSSAKNPCHPNCRTAVALVAWPTGGGRVQLRESRQLELLAQIFQSISCLF